MNKQQQTDVDTRTVHDKIGDILDDDRYNLWAMLQLTRHVMASARNAELSAIGLSSIEASVLFTIQVIERAGRRPTLSELSRWLYRRPHSISQLLDRMSRKGLVAVVTDQKGSNAKKAVLTEKSWEVFDRSCERLSINHIMSCLSDEERAQLWTLTTKLRDAAVREIGVNQTVPWPAPK